MRDLLRNIIDKPRMEIYAFKGKDIDTEISTIEDSINNMGLELKELQKSNSADFAKLDAKTYH